MRLYQANRALLLFIEEVNGLKEGGNVWPSLPEHPGFLPSSDELHDRGIAVDAALLAGDLHPLNAIAGPSGSSISEARASAAPEDAGGYFSLSQTGEVLTTIDPALLAIGPPNVTVGEGEAESASGAGRVAYIGIAPSFFCCCILDPSVAAYLSVCRFL